MIDLALYPPPEPGDPAILVGDLRPAFPGNDAIYGDGLGDGLGDGNPAIADRVKTRLTERFPAVADRVKFDPEYSGFYCYGMTDDLMIVRTVIETMANEVGL